MSTTTNNNTVYDNVVYKGEPGILTLTDKFFHYQANIVDATVKCSWKRVEKRQLSPPGSTPPMLKLVLVSGKTAIFEVTSARVLIDLVRDVKARMEPQQQEQPQAPEEARSNHHNPARVSPSPDSPPPIVDDDDESDDDREKPKKRRSSHPPVLECRDEFLSQAHDKRDDSRRTICYCCWDSIYCWLCLAAIVATLVTMILLIYFFAIRDDGSSSNPAMCEDPSASSCPPDNGLERRYGIRAVEYVWTPESVRLEYYISDYILDASISYLLYDGVECRGSQRDEIVPNENEWIQVDLVDGAPQDGGANLYNDGKGTRQMDVVLKPRRESNLLEAPFYSPNSAAVDRGFLRLCVGFQVHYNRVDDYQELIEVNYIDNALQLNIGITDENFGVIQDVQIKTVTRPVYKL